MSGAASLPNVGPKRIRRRLSAIVMKYKCPTIISAQKCGFPMGWCKCSCCQWAEAFCSLTALYRMEGFTERHFAEDINGHHFKPFCHVHSVEAMLPDFRDEGFNDFSYDVFLVMQSLSGKRSRERGLHLSVLLWIPLASNAKRLKARAIYIVEFTLNQSLLP